MKLLTNLNFIGTARQGITLGKRGCWILNYYIKPYELEEFVFGVDLVGGRSVEVGSWHVSSAGEELLETENR